MQKIIALTGAKGSGKDTVANIIKSNYDNVKTVAFADPIKNVVQHIFDLDSSSVDQYDLFKRTTIEYQLPGYINHTVSARHVVREIGMLMRSYDEKQFNEYVKQQFNTDHSAIWVVTDLRFDNEYTMLKQIGAKTIKIDRPDYHYDGHITERGFDDHLVNYTINNDADMQALENKVNDIMSIIIKEWQ
jgi:hypothetical protein